MPVLNARCVNPKCRTIFLTGLELDNIGTAMVKDSTFGPCPKCGDIGRAILDGIPFSVSAGKVTVPQGALSASDLAVAMSTLTTFQRTQENRQQAEQQIAQIAPQLKPIIPFLPLEKLLLIVGMLLALISMWQQQPQAQVAAAVQIEQIVQTVRQDMAREIDNDIATAFRLYEAGKQSAHAIQKKIIRFFPELASFIKGMSYSDKVITLALILAALERWKPKGKLKDFQPSEEQYAELIAEIKGMRSDLKAKQDSEDSKEP